MQINRDELIKQELIEKIKNKISDYEKLSEVYRKELEENFENSSNEELELFVKSEKIMIPNSAYAKGEDYGND